MNKVYPLIIIKGGTQYFMVLHALIVQLRVTVRPCMAGQDFRKGGAKKKNCFFGQDATPTN